MPDWCFRCPTRVPHSAMSIQVHSKFSNFGVAAQINLVALQWLCSTALLSPTCHQGLRRLFARLLLLVLWSLRLFAQSPQRTAWATIKMLKIGHKHCWCIHAGCNYGLRAFSKFEYCPPQDLAQRAADESCPARTFCNREEMRYAHRRGIVVQAWPYM